jgi:oxygen-dependent protoporphyrinogen oxidase
LKVVVVGGGVTGLTAAYRLVRLGASVRLLERSERVGGIVSTLAQGGRVLEHGPDCFLTGAKPWAHDLAIELGLEGELARIRPAHRRSFVLRRGRLEPIPQGFHLVAPTALEPFLRSRILSWPGKLRAIAELSLSPRSPPGDDESLRSFVTRRFGRELFERLVEPLVAGIYTADPRELSLRATFPQFLDMERASGSVLASLSSRRVEASGARYGLFASFRRGVQELTDALRARLPEGVLETGTTVQAIRKDGRSFVVEHERGEERAEGVLVAIPAPLAARVLRGVDPELADLLVSIPYASAATANFVFAREQVRHALDGMGFVCPAVEKRFLLACSFSSTKFDGRVGGDEVLLRAFVGGAQHAAHLELAPAEIEARALAELRGLLGIEGETRARSLTIMRDSMPQYVLGHLGRVMAIETRVARTTGLELAGNAFHGVGVPDCIRSAEAAARRLVAAKS